MSKKPNDPESKAQTRTIQVNYLARVEGEGSLYLRFRDRRVEEVRLKIFEPPRFFEALLRGRSYAEAPDVTARICGICPVAYQMSAVHAMENAFGVKVEGPIRELRRLFYCGEWISSHTLHVYMLHAPDFLGYESAVHMAKDHPREVERGLALKKVGGDLMRLLGGREVHPINVRVGGFYRVPSRAELQGLIGPLERARQQALETVRWVAAFPFPEFEQDYLFVALRHPIEYPLNEGRIASNRGLDIEPSEFEQHFEERQVEYSHALHCFTKPEGLCYHVGPMARYALNADRLPASVRELAQSVGLTTPCRNPFQSIVVRSLEILYACEEALRVIRDYEPPARPFLEVQPRAAIGFGATEAPRGILFHHYQIDDCGNILQANIIPPTSQNQKMIEEDLRGLAIRFVDESDDRLRYRAEQAIRNYDPCISCATHFLNLTVDRQ